MSDIETAVPTSSGLEGDRQETDDGKPESEHPLEQYEDALETRNEEGLETRSDLFHLEQTSSMLTSFDLRAGGTLTTTTRSKEGEIKESTPMKIIKGCTAPEAEENRKQDADDSPEFRNDAKAAAPENHGDKTHSEDSESPCKEGEGIEMKPQSAQGSEQSGDAPENLEKHIAAEKAESTPKERDSDDVDPQVKKRNSLIDPPKTVTEDGESFYEEESEPEEDPWVTADSNLKDPRRRICVVTTAALPWRTGTAVNPLLRALYLTRGRPKHYVTLAIPWLAEESDRISTLGKQYSFSNQAEQEEWIRDYCRTRAGCEGKLYHTLLIM
jgi:hypothetical protein